MVSLWFVGHWTTMQSTERAITGSVTTTRLYTYDAKAATNHMYMMGYTKAAFMYAEISISCNFHAWNTDSFSTTKNIKTILSSWATQKQMAVWIQHTSHSLQTSAVKSWYSPTHHTFPLCLHPSIMLFPVCGSPFWLFLCMRVPWPCPVVLNHPLFHVSTALYEYSQYHS